MQKIVGEYIGVCGPIFLRAAHGEDKSDIEKSGIGYIE